MYLDALHRLANRALQAGAARRQHTIIEWSVSGSCTAPVTIEYWSRPDTMNAKYIVVAGYKSGVKGKGGPLTVIMEVPCKKCKKCLARRAYDWHQRALFETSIAPRTWFGTLTFNPEWHYQVLLRCRHHDDAQGIDFDALSSNEQFTRRHNMLAVEVTKYLKRIRKLSKARLRYLLVAEAHKSGNPHYHMLVHEVDTEVPIRHALLKGQWTAGFSDFKLVSDPKAATYCCKYLSKDAKARVRASLLYGEERAMTLSQA